MTEFLDKGRNSEINKGIQQLKTEFILRLKMELIYQRRNFHVKGQNSEITDKFL